MKIIFIIFVYFITFSTPASAYLDPGLGTMLIQGLLAVIATVAAYASLYWKKFKDLVKKLFRFKKN